MEKKVSENNLAVLALLAASILGLYIRLNPVLPSDFPLNDSSLYVQKTEEQHKANSRFPGFDGNNNYNNALASLPFSTFQETDHQNHQPGFDSGFPPPPIWIGG